MVNAASIYAAKAFEGLLQFAMLAFILSRIERDYYAGALLIMSIQANIELARGGMQKATLKYIAEYQARGDWVGAKGILSSSTAMQGAVGLAGLLICLLISPFASVLFSLPEVMQAEARQATVLLGFGVAFAFALTPWNNSLAAQERYDLTSLAEVSGRVFRAALIVALLLSGAPSLLSLVFATVAGSIFERLICIALVRKIAPHLRFSAGSISRRHTRDVFRFSVLDFFHTLSGFMYSQGSLYIAAHFVSLNAVAALGIIGNITALTTMLMSQFAQMLVPVASRLEARGENARLTDIVVHGSAVTVFGGGVVMAGLLPWMGSLLAVWLGPSYAELALPAVVLLCATFLVNSLTCIHNSLGGVGRVGVDALSNAVCTLLGLGIGILLASGFDQGLLGLVAGLFFARLFRFLFVSCYGARVFGFPLAKFFWDAYMQTYLLLAGISLAALRTGVTAGSRLQLIAAGASTALIFLITGFFWIIDPSDRTRLARAISSALHSFGLRGFIQVEKVGLEGGDAGPHPGAPTVGAKIEPRP